MALTEALNADYIDAQYRKWKAEPNSLSSDWQFFFKGFEMAGSFSQPLTVEHGKPDQALKQARVESLIYRYRDLGHFLACMDPLAACPTDHPLLNLKAFNLDIDDLNKSFFTRRFSHTNQEALLKDIIRILKETYCRSIGVEYMHIQNPEERHWLQEQMEPMRNQTAFDKNTKLRILEKLTRSALFEQFLNKKYAGVTRFSLEGGDVIIPMLDTFVNHTAAQGCSEIMLGMAHRGRLNVQTHILRKPYEEIFSEFEHCYDPDQLTGAGDVKYHNGYLADLKTPENNDIRIFLVNNPSHLEAVDPVVEGMARARQDILNDRDRKKVLPLLIHGDAAFAGQGIVAETLNMSRLKGYTTGGTVHVIINNQIGYTTIPEESRSTRYSTDVAKMLMVPVFHVHGENPEAVLHVIRMAADYRNRYARDVVIDVICYRRFGHNEGDEPYFTQPSLYDRIRERPPLNRIYADELLAGGVIEKTEIEKIENRINSELNTAYQEIHGSSCLFPEQRFFEEWEGFHGIYSHDPVETGVKKEKLTELSSKLNTVPDSFTIHPKLGRLLKKRAKAVESGEGIDWANAEALAFATLLSEGIPVRLSGQDVGRGTFSHRHSVLTDRKTDEHYIPLNALGNGQAPFRVHNSHLAEAGVVGFEYGYSVTQPKGLTLWEAQFGDFANGAQTIIDLFITSGQSKWQRCSGLVMLLPHGWEGLGPEHSSARPERFLQLCADDNIQVCNLTTPAQYFHLLRRQIISDCRKPLILMTPKSLLRHPMAVSGLSNMTDGAFQTVLNDSGRYKNLRKVILCSGKIYYQLVQRRHELDIDDIAIVRLEQFYPFPKARLEEIIAGYKNAKEWAWVQEEPNNMGAWSFLQPRLEQLIGKFITYIGRKAASSPATGFPVIYKKEQAAISDEAVGTLSNGRGISS